MASSGQPGGQPLQALLADGSLAGSWTLDPARSEVILHTRHTWGLLPLRGAFTRVSGHGTVTEAGQASGVIAVTAESVDTKNPRRDKHLRSADFFDVANHPEITVAVESVTPGPAGVRVAGTLTVRHRTNPVSFDAQVSVADGGAELTLDGELPVNRGDYGLNWNFLGIAAMDSRIEVRAVFTRG
jgi:polyisoprenoid-binding protein YceI